MTIFEIKKHKKLLFVLPYADRTGSSNVLFNFISFLNNINLYDVSILCSTKSYSFDYGGNNNLKLIIYEKYCDSPNIIKKIIHRSIYYYRYLFFLISYCPDVVYSNTINNCGQIVISKLLGRKTIVHVHEGRAAIERAKWKLKISDMFVDQYIVVSKYVQRVLSDYISSVNEVIYNGVKLDSISMLKRNNIDIINIGVIGTIHPIKGQLIAIKAIQHLAINFNIKNVKLNIIGGITDQNYFQKLNDYIYKNGLSNSVIFRGELTNLKEIYESLDIVVISSYEESFSLVKIEAMSLGKILIASNVGGIPENIENGENALLFIVGDHIDLSKKIEMVMNDTDLREKITRKAYNTVASLYNINNTNSRLLKVVNRISGEMQR